MSIEERLSDIGGWLNRPIQAIQAVRSEHSLQSITALESAQSQLGGKFELSWKLPMPEREVTPVDWLLDLIQQLPIHGRDLRDGSVALAWTLAPGERKFLCKEAAKIRTTGVPGIQSPEPIDRSKECDSPTK
jgi:hypothetical protein